jgi:hypothetical protein
MKYYILFESYNWGLSLEAKLKSEKIKYTISPTPREFSVSCGMSIIYNVKDEDRIKEIVEKHNIRIKGFEKIDK